MSEELEAKALESESELAIFQVKDQDKYPTPEIEAWILAEGSALAKRLDDERIASDPNAELKNFQQPPSKRINELFLSHKKTRYQKIIDGRPLFSDLKFEPVYRCCRYFKAFYDELRTVAIQALSSE